MHTGGRHKRGCMRFKGYPARRPQTADASLLSPL